MKKLCIQTFAIQNAPSEDSDQTARTLLVGTFCRYGSYLGTDTDSDLDSTDSEWSDTVLVLTSGSLYKTGRFWRGSGFNYSRNS